MRNYRALKRLIGMAAAGEIVNVERLSEGDIQTLLARGAIAQINAPPLAEIPGWGERAEALADAGMETALDVLNASDEEIGGALAEDPTEVRAEIVELLTLRIDDDECTDCG